MRAAAALLAAASGASGAVPTVEIAAGVDMPVINLGTCCGSQPKVGVEPWIAAGGNGIDTAYDYGKTVSGGPQSDVKKAVKSSGAKRSSLFLTTKIPAGYGVAPGDCGTGSAGAATALNYVKTDIKELGTHYVDLVLIHKPCGSTAANQALWKGLEEALAQNLTRAIGVSNFKQSHLTGLMKTAKVKPAVNQCAMSVQSHDDATIAYCQKEGITYEAFDAMKGCNQQSKTMQHIGKTHGKSVSQVCLRYIVDRGCVMAVGTGADATKAAAYAKENLDIFDFKLNATEMDKINKL